MTAFDAGGLIVAAAGGAAVGLERQWSGHADGPAARFAGIRTFTLLGIVAGLSGWLSARGMAAVATALVVGAVAVTVVAYLASSRRDVDGTTEVAALVVIAAGVVAGMGSVRLASAIVTVETLLLLEKSRLHALVRGLDDVELRAAARFAVMAVVVLPLLPDRAFGPFGGVHGRELWLLVLFFSGLSFIGHVLTRRAGPSRGYAIGGALGGLMSSTSVTLTFARMSRSDPASERDLAVGALAANAILYGRVLVALSVLNAPLAAATAPYLVAPAVTVLAAAALIALRGTRRDAADAPMASRNPLQLTAALQMAGVFQLVLFAVHAARDLFGRTGVITTAAVLGLTDVDALTVSMARDATRTASLAPAAVAVAVGIAANTGLKLGIACICGSARFRLLVGGVLALVLIAALSSIAFA